MVTYTKTVWVNGQAPARNDTNLNNAEEGIANLYNEFDANTILKADSDNTPIKLTLAEQRILGRITGGVITGLTAAQMRTLCDVPSTSEAVLDTLFDAYSILYADTDDTPAALSVAASRLIGRKSTGGIAALTAAEARTLLSVSQSSDTVLKSLYDAYSILYADADDTPSALTVAGSRLVGRKSTGGIAALTVAEVEAMLTGLVPKTLYDAYSILYADTDNTPAALAVAASRFVGRKAAGGIAAMTVAEAKTLLAIVVADISDHNKAAHDALNIDADTVDSKEPGTTAGKLVYLDASAYLALSQIVGNVPALDAVGKLILTGTSQIGTKATDLAALWDKTTKIVKADLTAAEFNAANGICGLDASGDVPDAQIPSLNASKIGAGDLAAARMSTNIVAAIAGLDPTFTSVTFDDFDAIKRNVSNDQLNISGGTGGTDGAHIRVFGGDSSGFEGNLDIVIGDYGAGKTPASVFQILYFSDGSSSTIMVVDKNGNITTAARADFSAGVRLGTAQDANHFDDGSHGASSTTMYIGNKTINTTFTACHHYQLGDLDLQKGESIKLIDRKIYRTTQKQDKAITGIFWGVTDYKDSLGNIYLKNEEVDEEYDDENDKKEITKAEAIEKVPITEKVETEKRIYILAESETGKIKIVDIPEKIEIETGKLRERLKSGVTLDEKTGKFLKPIRKTRKQITNNPVRISDGSPAAIIDFAYSVAVLGDSYEEHDKNPLLGAWVTIDAGVMEEGDFLCSSAKAGYLEKQPDDIRHNYTKAISRQKITSDTKKAYIELI